MRLPLAKNFAKGNRIYDCKNYREYGVASKRVFEATP
jgi:hypothetical protein